jgi:hypothetical protein
MLVLVLYSTSVVTIENRQTIWSNLNLWVVAAQQQNVSTGLIEVIQHIVDIGGCTGVLHDATCKARAQDLFAYMSSLQDFGVVLAARQAYLTNHNVEQYVAACAGFRPTLVSLRVQALQHFCPDLNIPESTASWDGVSVDDASAWLVINQQLDASRAAPYIKALLILMQMGY